jgi:hypothetical protein
VIGRCRTARASGRRLRAIPCPEPP